METSRKEGVPTKEKPSFLYHGSRHKDIEELEPRDESVRDLNEGPVVFATQELALATIFMVREVVESGRFNDIPYAVIIGSRESFVENDKGGHIYILPVDTFGSDSKKGLGGYEWTSREKVKPSQKIEYSSRLDAMIENGVQVYFVDEVTCQKIKISKDDVLSILQNMESENQKRGINFRSFSLAEK